MTNYQVIIIFYIIIIIIIFIIGEWYGPSTISLVLRDIAKVHRCNYNGEIEIYVTQGILNYYTTNTIII